jgi:catechol O-methyltransferase
VKDGGADGQQWNDGREARLVEYIYSHPELESLRGNPEKILAAMDEFSSQQDLLISVGAQKAGILRHLIASEPPRVVIELGGYLGYSAILFGDQMRRNTNVSAVKQPPPVVWSLEASPVYAAFAMSMVDLAGLSDIVKVVTGSADTSLRRLQQTQALKQVDFLFMDHQESLYTTDLKLCEELGILRSGSIIAADNVVRPGAPEYRDHVRNHSKFESSGVSCFITPGDLPVCSFSIQLLTTLY